MTRPFLALCLLALPACHFRLQDSVTVDGVRLPAHHQEVLTLESWPESFVIEANRGDLRLESGEGPTSLTVLVHERELGEAHAAIEDGRLVARAENGAKCAIGRVTVRTGSALKGLRLSTGMGDLHVLGVSVGGDLRLATGMGDVVLRAAGAPVAVSIASGKGDIEAGPLRCERLEAETGMGDIRIEALESGEADLSSGLGDVEVVRSKGDSLRASTGLGDVELIESSYSSRRLDTGLGSVRER